MQTMLIYVIMETALLPKLYYTKKYKIVIVENPQHTFLLLFDVEINNVVLAENNITCNHNK